MDALYVSEGLIANCSINMFLKGRTLCAARAPFASRSIAVELPPCGFPAADASNFSIAGHEIEVVIHGDLFSGRVKLKFADALVDEMLELAKNFFA